MALQEFTVRRSLEPGGRDRDEDHQSKQCTTCRETKPVDDFYKRSGTTRDGLDIYCKECRKTYHRARNDPEYYAAYYQQNKERHKGRMKRWRSMNKERFKAMIDDWCKRNTERHKEIQSIARGNRRARLKNVPSEDIGIVTLYARDNGICGICELGVEPKDASIDHVTPISKGGYNTWNNVQLAHLKCNLQKGNRI